MLRTIMRLVAVCVLELAVLAPAPLFAEVSGVAPGIPEPEHRNVIVQMFNWSFDDIKGVMTELRKRGYSHIHVSPPQKSNERVWQWWGRYQPVDYSKIEGPLGNESAFQQMNDAAEAKDVQIIVDVVANHTVDVTEQPDPPFITMSGNFVATETFPQFSPSDFHERCTASTGNPSEQNCWLFFNLADLKTETTHVQDVMKDYLEHLADLGADGYRFDAAIHIKPEFFPAVLSAAPGKYAFGEIIKDNPDHFKAWIDNSGMDFYDFPLAATMRKAFAPGGDLRTLKSPKDFGGALPGPLAVTFVRNHDLDRGQNFDRGIEDGGSRHNFGIGWNEAEKSLNRTDVRLAYAYLFGREDGLPYVFVDMNTLPSEQQDDLYDDPFVVAGIRFHNLCLANTGGVPRRPEHWLIETPNTIGWQRGDDRLIVINKAGEWYEIKDQGTSLLPGEYKEVRTGWPLHVKSDGTIEHWGIPPRSAMMFFRVGA